MPTRSRSSVTFASSAWGRNSSMARPTSQSRSSGTRSSGSTPARRRETSRIWFTRRSRRSVERRMMSTIRACLGVSGPGTPSASRCAASRTEVMRRAQLVRERGEELLLDLVVLAQAGGHGVERAGQHADLVAPPTRIGSLNEPAATAVVAADRRRSERVIRSAMTAVARSASTSGRRQRDADAVPGAVLQPGHLGLRAQHAARTSPAAALHLGLGLLAQPRAGESAGTGAGGRSASSRACSSTTARDSARRPRGRRPGRAASRTACGPGRCSRIRSARARAALSRQRSA